ncbi:hypothetical protein [Cohnella abietis]|uniref:YtkA-like domain-containing protein n=1 Tax=Cohnella abietis TaxID=2507935 RepID=A0A3T1D6Y5_9BACL|nr:hypothetical protein [Cohnella abietis]BBI33825.1 hypothetical protein KCTCHS21_32240 [Cohnella abietis]
MGISKESEEKTTVIEALELGGPNNGADGHTPLQMSLPSPGFWRLDAYFGNKFFDSITVQVHDLK